MQISFIFLLTTVLLNMIQRTFDIFTHLETFEKKKFCLFFLPPPYWLVWILMKYSKFWSENFKTSELWETELWAWSHKHEEKKIGLLRLKLYFWKQRWSYEIKVKMLILNRILHFRRAVWPWQQSELHRCSGGWDGCLHRILGQFPQTVELRYPSGGGGGK